jgi:hypothetical protein
MLQRNSTQSTDKYCSSLDVLSQMLSAKSCHVFVTFDGRNVNEFMVFHFTIQATFYVFLSVHLGVVSVDICGEI